MLIRYCSMEKKNWNTELFLYSDLRFVMYIDIYYVIYTYRKMNQHIYYF